MSKEKDAFERLPEIKTMLEENTDIKFEDGGYIYYGREQLAALAVCYINGAWMAWQAAKVQAVPEGYCVVPIESLEESLDWASVAKWDSPNNSRDEEINKHEEIIRAMLLASQEPK